MKPSYLVLALKILAVFPLFGLYGGVTALFGWASRHGRSDSLRGCSTECFYHVDGVRSTNAHRNLLPLEDE